MTAPTGTHGTHVTHGTHGTTGTTGPPPGHRPPNPTGITKTTELPVPPSRRPAHPAVSPGAFRGPVGASGGQWGPFGFLVFWGACQTGFSVELSWGLSIRVGCACQSGFSVLVQGLPTPSGRLRLPTPSAPTAPSDPERPTPSPTGSDWIRLDPTGLPTHPPAVPLTRGLVGGAPWGFQGRGVASGSAVM